MDETQSFDSIMNRMLDSVPANIDKREGSVIYCALAPAAAELAQMYDVIKDIINETFPDTASRLYLSKMAAERGIYAHNATNAILKAEFDKEVNMLSRFSGGALNYKVIESMGESGERYYYKVMCETPGTAGNSYLGTLIPIEEISGLKSAQIIEILIHGEDDETTDDFRARYINSVKYPRFGGNIADYMEYLSQLSDVGGGKIYPAWNGGGTVKVVFVNAQHEIPNDTLVAYVKEQLDPIDYEGLGYGMAPIGHVVTVEAAVRDEINIELCCTFVKGYDWSDVKEDVTACINIYLKELNAEWSNGEDTSTIVVRISQLEKRLLDITCILDVSNTKINGLEKNYEIDSDSVIVLGGVVNANAI